MSLIPGIGSPVDIRSTIWEKVGGYGAGGFADDFVGVTASFWPSASVEVPLIEMPFEVVSTTE